MIDLYLVKTINSYTPNPYNIYVDPVMERDSRSVMQHESCDARSISLFYTDLQDYWNYDYNWVIKLKRKKCSQN